jgi:selenocysteine lyase/cysteine desulfurase
VVKVDWKNGQRKQAYDTLYSKHRLALALTGSGDAAGLRFSPHIYNTMDDVNRAVAAVKTVLG